MKVIDSFNAAIERSEHLLALYHIVCDTRQRDVRSDWAKRFKTHMQWPDKERIVRIDGKAKNSLLILREAVGVSRDQFAHAYCSELLRAAVVSGVSALDRYVHDLVTEDCLKILRRKEVDIPKDFKKLQVSIVSVDRAIKHAKSKDGSRPGYLVKKAIQDLLHRQYTFQGPHDMDQAFALLGLKDFWRKISTKMREKPPVNELRRRLGEIARRRNQIVHEADVVKQTKARRVMLRDIHVSDAEATVRWLKSYVYALDTAYHA